jgi:hypothetical protein
MHSTMVYLQCPESLVQAADFYSELFDGELLKLGIEISHGCQGSGAKTRDAFADLA